MPGDPVVSRRQLLRAAVCGGVALALRPNGTWPPTGAPAGAAALDVPEIVWREAPGARTVCLTFDDWFDRAMVELALDIAAREGVRLTFFPIGRLVAQNADLVRRAAREGHELENHTWDHQRLDLGHCPVARIPSEIERQAVALRTVLGPGYRQSFLRPPGGFGILGSVNPYLVRAAEDANLRIAMWSVDSGGWRWGRRGDPTAVAAVVSAVLPGLGDGAVVLQHALPADVLALPTIIRAAKALGLRTATMAEGLPGVGSAPAGRLAAHPA